MDKKQELFHDQEQEDFTKAPSLYKVLFVKNDSIPKDFLSRLIVEFFQKSPEHAEKLADEIQNDGRAGIGLFSLDIALSKLLRVNQYLQQSQYPSCYLLQKIDTRYGL